MQPNNFSTSDENGGSSPPILSNFLFLDLLAGVIEGYNCLVTGLNRKSNTRSLGRDERMGAIREAGESGRNIKIISKDER